MIILLPHLETWQKDVYEYWTTHKKSKWVTTLSPRLCGKSILLEVLLIAASMAEERAVSMVVSPIYKQSAKLFNEISRIAALLISKANAGSMEITFINGSSITFASALQGDNLRGFTIKRGGILAIDEAAYIKDSFFYDILVPMTNVYHSDIFIFSTPKFKLGWFYDVFTQGNADTAEERANVKSFNWTKYDLSKYLTEEMLDLYRKRLPKLTFRAEYLGQFISADGMVFNDFKKCVCTSKEDKQYPLFVTIDWSTGSLQDSTAITIGQIQNGKLVIPTILHFNDKKTNETCDIILDIIKDYANNGFKEISIAVEKNSIGSVYYDVLKDKIEQYETLYNDSHDWRDEIEISILTITTTNKSKKDMVERLNVLFLNNKIVLPNDETLMNELAIFEATINNNGTVVYAAAGDGHDDTVMSLGFMVNYLWTDIEI